MCFVLQAIEDTLSVEKTNAIAALEAQIAEEKAIPGSLEALSDVFAINKEIAQMQYELSFREELLAGQKKIVQELDFLKLVESENKNLEKDLLIKSIVAGVEAEAANMEADILKQCVSDLEALSASQATA
jgi:hypothetical protein